VTELKRPTLVQGVKIRWYRITEGVGNLSFESRAPFQRADRLDLRLVRGTLVHPAVHQPCDWGDDVSIQQASGAHVDDRGQAA
jgi:hypothetical protein